MKTKKDSETGTWEESFYATSEIKVCPKCGIEIKETYSATIIRDEE